MWGHRLLWWGRIGKIMEFAAGLSIVVDILGPQRLTAIGDSLHDWFSFDAARARVAKRVNQFPRALPHWVGRVAEIALGLIGVVGFILLIHACVATMAKGDPDGSILTSFASTLPFVAISILLFLAGFRMVVFLFMISIDLVLPLTVFAIGTIVDGAVIEPLAWVLRLRDADRWIKIAAAVLLVLGFQFDLLAS
jgi:hypothetical protein